MPMLQRLAGMLALVAGCNASEPGGIDFWLSDGSRSRHDLVAFDMPPAWRLLAADLDADATSELVAARNDDVVVVRPDGEIVSLVDLADVVALRWNGGELLALVSDDEDASLSRVRCEGGAARCIELDEIALPDHTAAFELADLDRDGALDLLTRDAHGLAWSRGDANGAWGLFERFADAPGGNFDDNPYTTSIATGDIDGDGAIDVAMVDEQRGVLVFLGAAARDDAPLVLGEHDEFLLVLVADVTGDGVDDLVVDQSDRTWVYHHADGRARTDVIRSDSYFGVSTVGELDDAPGPDLVILVDGAPHVAKWIGGRWRLATLAVSESMRSALFAVAVGDFDGDGRDDFALARPEIAYELP